MNNKGAKMKKIIVAIMLIVSLLTVFPVYARSNCPSWLESYMSGTCLSGIKNESSIPYPGYFRLDNEFQVGRWLIQQQIEVPVYSVLLGSNLNNFIAVPIAVWQKSDMHAMYIFVKLICDRNGSMSPIISLSIPAQISQGENYYFGVVNWYEATRTPCSYPKK
jgi:hypothetical protein